MKQANLFKTAGDGQTPGVDLDQRNLECARLILADPAAHGGADAFPTMWARAVVARLGSGFLNTKGAASA
jgi:hypothetical protein